MPIHPGQIERDSPLLEHEVTLLADAPGNSLSGVVIDRRQPAFDFQVKEIELICEASTASVDVDVQVAGSTVLTSLVADPAARTLVKPSLVSTVATLRGSAGDNLDLVITTDSYGNITLLRVRAVLRPWPAGGDPQ